MDVSLTTKYFFFIEQPILFVGINSLWILMVKAVCFLFFFPTDKKQQLKINSELYSIIAL